MKFSQFKCKECESNDLEVYNSIIDYSKDPAVGYIAFVCKTCGHEFEIEMEAEVVA
jgi:transcription elongation factor Elf1